MPEVITTESFWAPIIGATALLFMAAIIVIDRYRRPEVYSKKQPPKNKGEKHGTSL